MNNMSEWHVFTKDGEEYKGEYILIEGDYTVLFHYVREKVITEDRYLTSFWKITKKEEIKKYRAYDYMIPTEEIFRVERWDV